MAYCSSKNNSILLHRLLENKMFFNVDYELYLIFKDRKMSLIEKFLFFLKITYNIILVIFIMCLPLLAMILSVLIGEKQFG